MELWLFLLLLFLIGLVRELRKPKPQKPNYTGTVATPKLIPTYKSMFMSPEAKQHYLKTDDWALRRAARLAMDDYTCQHCYATTNLNVHHITYERLGCEDIDTDLVTLCKACHNRLHNKLGYGRTTNYPIEDLL
jgi:hypothetical protein